MAPPGAKSNRDWKNAADNPEFPIAQDRRQRQNVQERQQQSRSRYHCAPRNGEKLPDEEGLVRRNGRNRNVRRENRSAPSSSSSSARNEPPLLAPLSENSSRPLPSEYAPSNGYRSTDRQDPGSTSFFYGSAGENDSRNLYPAAGGPQHFNVLPDYLSAGAGSGALTADQEREINEYNNRVCTGYLLGQVANVAKAGVWWSTFGIIAEALTKIHLAVGLTRLAFNVALVLMSPIAGSVSETRGIRSLLQATTLGRLIIWCAVIPVSWFACNVLQFTGPQVFCGLFALCIFADGGLVSFANVVDVDCGGLDTLAAEYHLSVSPQLREKFNRLHQTVFDFSFIGLTPPLAYLLWKLASTVDASSLCDSVTTVMPSRFPTHDFTIDAKMHVTKQAPSEIAAAIPTGPGSPSWLIRALCKSDNVDVAFLLFGICTIFGLLSLYSLWTYMRNLSTKRPFDELEHSSIPGSSLPGSRANCWAVTKDRLRDVIDGCRIVLHEKPLKWRLTFLAMETALEDAVVSVIIPQVALRMTPILYGMYRHNGSAVPPPTGEPTNLSKIPGGWTFVNIVAVGLIAVGKFGGLLSSTWMANRWISPPTVEVSGPYRRLFVCELISSLFLTAFPIAFMLGTHDISNWASPLPFLLTLVVKHRFAVVTGTLACASFSYFALATCPKVGFAGLLHAIVLQTGVDSRVFSFVGTFVTVMDAAIILLISTIFACCDSCLSALIITAGLYALFGVAEVFAGPRLVLRPIAAAQLQEYDSGNRTLYNDDGMSPRDLHNTQISGGPDKLAAGNANSQQFSSSLRTCNNSAALEPLILPPQNESDLGSWA